MNWSTSKIALAYRDPANLKLDPKNPRRHSQKRFRELKQSISIFGFVVPVIIDDAHNVIAGHGRIQAALALGLPAVPVVSVEHLSEEKRRALMLADNRLAQKARWDKRLLGEQLTDLSLTDLDFSLDVTGFHIADAELNKRDQPAKPNRRDLAMAEVEPLPGGPVSRLGELWQLGPHRVLCGNAFDLSAVQSLVGEHQADMVFTNWPVKMLTNAEQQGPHYVVAVHNSCLNTTLSRNHLVHSVPGALHFICLGWPYAASVVIAARQTRYRVSRSVCLDN